MWEELGIAPTDDALLIRKAYAARLKSVTKSGDRIAFQRLRAAYERASTMAANAARRSGQAQPPIEMRVQQSHAMLPLSALTPTDEGRPPEAKLVETPAHAIMPETPPPAPDQPDPRAMLFAEIRRALAARDTDAAIGLYERGLAQGLLPLGASQAVLDDIMSGPVNDKTLSGARFEALITRVGWNVPTVGGITRVQAAASARLDAERWLRQLAYLAAGKKRIGPLLRTTHVTKWIGALIRRRGEIGNARLMLKGGIALPRVSRLTVADLRSQLASYRHFRTWVEGRIPERAVDRAERLIEIDQRWGRVIRRLWVFGLFLVLALVLSRSGTSQNTAIGTAYVVVMGLVVLNALIKLGRSLYNWCMEKLF